jgi:glucose/arabinose dehydrogenase
MATGTVWLHEHGPRGGDEVNKLDPGANYGWPAITYGIDYSGARISPYTEYEGMEQPVKYWDPSIAPSGLTVYRGNAFPEWNGNLFVGALKDRDVRRLVVAGGKVTEEDILFEEIGERIRDIRTGPDGFLYILTDSRDGRLLRIRPD